jgi:hypothetical protein
MSRYGICEPLFKRVESDADCTVPSAEYTQRDRGI